MCGATWKAGFAYCALHQRNRAQIRRSYQIAEAVIVGQVPDSYVVVPEESILDAMEFEKEMPQQKPDLIVELLREVLAEKYHLTLGTKWDSEIRDF